MNLYLNWTWKLYKHFICKTVDFITSIFEVWVGMGDIAEDRMTFENSKKICFTTVNTPGFFKNIFFFNLMICCPPILIAWKPRLIMRKGWTLVERKVTEDPKLGSYKNTKWSSSLLSDTAIPRKVYLVHTTEVRTGLG